MKTSPDNKIVEMFSADGGYLYDKIAGTVNSFDMEDMISDGVLVGLSGGADSVMLLYFLYEYRRRNAVEFDIVACHINHMIRSAEAKRDLLFSKEVAENLNIPFLSFNIDVPLLAENDGLGIEEAARNARYSKFDEIIRSRNDINTIAVAHNASDNLETVIYNMMRGCGLQGACGIPPVRGNVIRPLIRLSKAEIVDYLTRFDLPYVIDSTNSETEYTRNYIRHEIAPKLSRLSSSPEAMITRFTDSIRTANSFLNKTSKALYNLVNDNGVIKSDRLIESDVAVSSRVISLFVEDNTGHTPESKHINLILDALSHDNTSISLPGGYSFVIHNRECTIISDASLKRDDRIFHLTLGLNFLDGYDAMIYFGSESINAPIGYTKSFSAKVSGKGSKDVFVRFRREGDSYRYGGMTHKLKKVFNDRNIPTHERERIPVVCDESGILWVPGLPPRDENSHLNEKNIRITLFLSDSPDSDRRIYTAKQR